MATPSLLSAIDESIRKGIDYLGSKNPYGHWTGFPTLAGTSDIWVTGFIVTHIHDLCSGQFNFKNTKDYLLQTQYPTGGWSYSAPVPPDADSTAWCLQGLIALNALDEKRKAAATTYLTTHYTGTGIATFTTDGGIASFIGVPMKEMLVGWTSAHADVSLAALLAYPDITEAATILNWVEQQSNPQGLLHSYWWRGPFYATALYLRFLQKTNRPIPASLAASISGFLKTNELPAGGFAIEEEKETDGFSTALALEIQCRIAKEHSDTESTSYCESILQLQQENGSWQGKKILRIPVPYIINPNNVVAWDNTMGGGNAYIEDRDGLFTTTLCCYALNLFRNTFKG